MKLFDTHAHIYDKAFDNDRDSMLEDVFEQVGTIVCPSEDVATSRLSSALSQKYPQIYAAVGIHPQETAKAVPEDLEQLRQMAEANPKIVAVGEIGLDYYYLNSPKDIQKEWFGRQIELAEKLDLPIIIHDRDAHGDMLRVLQEHRNKKLRGILHCYSGSYETAETLIHMGFYISFAGPVVFPKSTALKEVARRLPLSRMLVETDSPYLTPPPFRGRRNDPSKVFYVAEEIARLKGISLDTVIETTEKNAKDIYRIS